MPPTLVVTAEHDPLLTRQVAGFLDHHLRCRVWRR
jgi:hypothetical protein